MNTMIYTRVREAQQSSDLPFSAIMILEHLAEHGPATSTEIAGGSLLSTASVSQEAFPLLTGCLIKQVSVLDRRKKPWALTKKGRDVLDELHKEVACASTK